MLSWLCFFLFWHNKIFITEDLSEEHLLAWRNQLSALKCAIVQTGGKKPWDKFFSKLTVPGYHCDGSLWMWFQDPGAVKEPPKLYISHHSSQQLYKTWRFIHFTAVIHHGLWLKNPTSNFCCVSPLFLQGVTSKSTLLFLDCFAVSDSFNTDK